MAIHLVMKLRILTVPCTRMKSTKSGITSSFARKQFLDFFVQRGHTHVRSSPVRAFWDPSVPFVNAGMVQFKSILEGKVSSPWLRVANSQKCARVGGSHNDLDVVGKDGYHHTFFEMLGNWSFGDYFKQDACEMAWELLTGPYGLNQQRLYVTYFGGDPDLGLEPDLECVDIWRRIGVQPDHILPFGVKENFWEMGLSGPCGPCTEIHIDHVPGRQQAQERVNGGHSDLTELWNLVFVQYNRNLDGSLKLLPQSHVDTGMGLERLVAILNGHTSNYDSDLFRPLLQAIQKVSGVPAYAGTFGSSSDEHQRDEAYRILSDHARLLTVAISDGVLPCVEYKLQWILRKALLTAKNCMNSDYKLLLELTNHVCDVLNETYPDIGRNLNKVENVISHEAEIFESILKTKTKSWVSLVKDEPRLEDLLLMGVHPVAITQGYEKISKLRGQELPGSFAYQLYDSHGLNKDMIQALANIVGVRFNPEEFKKTLSEMKMRSKFATASKSIPNDLYDTLHKANIPVTDDSFKYHYQKIDQNNYEFPKLEARVVGLVVDGQLRNSVEDGLRCGIITDKTNFYHEAGGQVCDRGCVKVDFPGEKGSCLDVVDVQIVDGYVIHYGTLNKGCIKTGDKVMLEVTPDVRLSCMRNHTAAHLLHGELQRLLPVTRQEGCSISADQLKFTFSHYGSDLNTEGVSEIEGAVRSTIADGLPVQRRTLSFWEIMDSPQVTLIPSETYTQENLHVIDINKSTSLLSSEACCGTHVHNTADIGSFSIAHIVQNKSKKMSIIAQTGEAAQKAIDLGKKTVSEGEALLNSVISYDITHKIQEDIDKLLNLFQRFDALHNLTCREKSLLPYVSLKTLQLCLDHTFDLLDRKARLLSSVEIEEAAKGKHFLVHILQSTSYLQSVPLNKVTRRVNIPLMVLAPNKKTAEVKARCCVPKEFASHAFNAGKWMAEVKDVFRESQEDNAASWISCNMNTVKAPNISVNLKEAVRTAEQMVRKYIKKVN